MVRPMTLFILSFLLACAQSEKSSETENNNIDQQGAPETEIAESMEIDFDIPEDLDIQGHRGARGILPENTIVGFRRAMSIGANTLELDVCTTADKKVIVSHEPWMSHEICLTPDRQKISEEEAMEHNIYEMTANEVKSYDCGGLMHPRFPKQGKVNTVKPLLIEVFEGVKSHAQRENLPMPRFNIEIKSSPEGDNLYHHEPAEFVRLVYEVINENADWSMINLQSFDIRILQEVRENYPSIRLALLVESGKDWKSKIDELGFTPEIYSPSYLLLDEQIVSDIQDEGMAVIPWTVNQPKDMIRMVRWGVDGLITDYPDRAVELFR